MQAADPSVHCSSGNVVGAFKNKELAKHLGTVLVLDPSESNYVQKFEEAFRSVVLPNGSELDRFVALLHNTASGFLKQVGKKGEAVRSLVLAVITCRSLSSLDAANLRIRISDFAGIRKIPEIRQHCCLMLAAMVAMLSSEHDTFRVWGGLANVLADSEVEVEVSNTLIDLIVSFDSKSGPLDSHIKAYINLRSTDERGRQTDAAKLMTRALGHLAENPEGGFTSACRTFTSGLSSLQSALFEGLNAVMNSKSPTAGHPITVASILRITSGPAIPNLPKLQGEKYGKLLSVAAMCLAELAERQPSSISVSHFSLNVTVIGCRIAM